MRRGIIGAIAVAAIAVAIVTVGQSQRPGPLQVETSPGEVQEEATGFLDQTQQLVSEITEQADTAPEAAPTAVGTLEAAEEAIGEAAEAIDEDASLVLGEAVLGEAVLVDDSTEIVGGITVEPEF